jgi:tetratricopeptide (TPR) repeat protein
VIGDGFVERGDAVNAMLHHRKSLAIREMLASTEPKHAELQSELAVGYERLGNALMLFGDREKAIAYVRKSIAIDLKLLKIDPNNVIWRRNTAVSYTKAGAAAALAGRIKNARSYFNTAIGIWRELEASGHAQPGGTSELAKLESLVQRLPSSGPSAAIIIICKRLLRACRPHRTPLR